MLNQIAVLQSASLSKCMDFNCINDFATPHYSKVLLSMYYFNKFRLNSGFFPKIVSAFLNAKSN